ncbi:MAG: glycosyltransferase [Burkholderiaceae bacterium]
MRLLFVLTDLPFPPHRNGVALINNAILMRLPQEYSADLAIASDPEPEAEATLRSEAQRIGQIHYLGSAGQRRFRVGNLISGALLGRNLFTKPQVARLVRQQRYDAIYVAPLMSFIDFRQVQPVFLNAVDSFARLNDTAHRRSGRFIDWTKRKLYERYESRVLPTVARASFVSQTDLEFVCSRRDGLALQCIPNGVDTEWFRDDGGIREPAALLFTGNFTYQPNADAAMYLAREVLPLVRAQRPDARLLIVGRAPPEGLARFPGVEVTGFVEDIRAYYQQATVFVCALRSGAGIKNKILEAMATGIPIVSSSLGMDGIEGAQQDRHFLEAEGAEATATQVLRLLSSDSEREALAKRARELVAGRMSWEVAAAAYIRALTVIASTGMRTAE